MPIYEYKCRKCGKKFEVFQGITDNQITSCEFCKGPVDKLISLSSFHLKGSGWYVTDYGGKRPSVDESYKNEKHDAATPSETTTDGSKSGSSSVTNE
ncbi:MAG TPA: zinc ribbon domain-containing protein [Syntrophales bacterium]|nr:zinc ribbon domain-containing protein [Syntrophales bacterium]